MHKGHIHTFSLPQTLSCFGTKRGAGDDPGGIVGICLFVCLFLFEDFDPRSWPVAV